MKKIYTKPNVKVLSVVPFCILQASKEDFQYLKNSSSRESDDRFDWGAVDDEEEQHSTELPKSPW